MIRFLIQRLILAFPTLLGVSLLSFFMIRWVPGDPVMILLGERGSSPAVYAEMRHKLGLDQSLGQQFLLYIKKVMQGDLGVSISTQQPVLREFWDRFPATVELGLASLLFALVGGTLIGVAAAVFRHSPGDYLLMGASLIGYSMPIFWWGLILILFFSVQLGWTPVSGRMGVMYDVPTLTGFLLIDVWFDGEGGEKFRSVISHLMLPCIALGTIPLAAIARMTRSSILEVLGEDYIRTARAKGLSYSKVVFKHGFKNALIPIITMVGLMASSVLTGAILTETIFSWPGIGKWLVGAIQSRDYPVIQGGVLLVAIVVIVVNIAVDGICRWVNPLFREGR